MNPFEQMSSFFGDCWSQVIKSAIAEEEKRLKAEAILVSHQGTRQLSLCLCRCHPSCPHKNNFLAQGWKGSLHFSSFSAGNITEGLVGDDLSGRFQRQGVYCSREMIRSCQLDLPSGYD